MLHHVHSLGSSLLYSIILLHDGLFYSVELAQNRLDFWYTVVHHIVHVIS